MPVAKCACFGLEEELFKRDIAQPGRALALGARCRRFESACPDQLKKPPVRVAFLVGLEHGVRTLGSELLVGDDELVKSEPYGTTEAQLKTILLSLCFVI